MAPLLLRGKCQKLMTSNSNATRNNFPWDILKTKLITRSVLHSTQYLSYSSSFRDFFLIPCLGIPDSVE
jgi:hypothetical protein